MTGASAAGRVLPSQPLRKAEDGSLVQIPRAPLVAKNWSSPPQTLVTSKFFSFYLSSCLAIRPIRAACSFQLARSPDEL